MKLLWLSVFLLGLALAKEEEKTDDLQDIEGRQKPLDPVAVAQNAVVQTQSLVTGTSDKLLLQLGNILSTLGLVDLKTVPVTGAAGAAAGAAAAGGLAALGGTIAAASGLKAALLSLAGSGLDIANFVLALIGLILLVAYLVKTEGDIKGLLGYDSGSGSGSASGYYRRESLEPYNAYSNYVNNARSFLDAPIVQRLTAMVHDAIAKYE